MKRKRIKKACAEVRVRAAATTAPTKYHRDPSGLRERTARTPLLYNITITHRRLHTARKKMQDKKTMMMIINYEGIKIFISYRSFVFSQSIYVFLYLSVLKANNKISVSVEKKKKIIRELKLNCVALGCPSLEPALPSLKTHSDPPKPRESDADRVTSSMKAFV